MFKKGVKPRWEDPRNKHGGTPPIPLYENKDSGACAQSSYISYSDLGPRLMDRSLDVSYWEGKGKGIFWMDSFVINRGISF